MRIQSSSVRMEGLSTDYEKTSIKRFKMEQINQLKKEDQFKQQLAKAKELLQEGQIEVIPQEEEFDWKMSDKDYQLLTMLEKLLSKILGKEVKFQLPEKIKVNPNAYDQHVNRIVQKGQTPVAQQPTEIYRQEVTFEKKSSLSFSASGEVKTEDGRSIQFDFSMVKNREIYHESTTQVDQYGRMVDPLVLSFDKDLPALTDQKYSFDLDNDGTMDQISFLTKGSGFLAFDKNEDGVVNNGGELFGTQSGSGFRDLAVYDQDQNGWIDENDEIFNKLRIWMKDDSGQDHLIALGEKGIGALFLGSVSTKFDLMASNLSKNGRVQESGIYLKEDGTAHNMHHVDVSL